MVGFACTATVRTYAQHPIARRRLRPDFVSRFADRPGPPVAVLQNLDSGGSAAVFGDVMCNSFKAFGAVGLVTDGPGRDYAGITPLTSLSSAPALSAHTATITCWTSRRRCNRRHQPATGRTAPWRCQRVTTIPRDIAADVADACLEFAAAEQVIIDVSQSGTASLDDLRAAYAEKARRVAALGAQLRARKLN